MHCIIYAAHQRLITPKMHPAKDALEHGCITPMMQLTKDASYQRYNALKMQCTKESSHWRCIAPDIHPTKDIIYQRCTICAARQNYNAPNMNQTVLSQGFSYTEIQPFGATGATYGQKCLFYGIFGPFLTPLEAPGAISMGPNGPNGPSRMYPTQI